MQHRIIDSPIGPLTLVGDEGVLSGLYMDAQRYAPDTAAFGPRTNTGLQAAAEQLAEYFAGRRTEFTVPLRLAGTEFQQRVWQALRTIPHGETWSYARLTTAIGRGPDRVRAVGAANGRNPISIVVPCHRVIGSDGRLTGYGGGLERKQYLLDLERRVAVS
ncbi:MAG: methylated-DNA--[protein]-cysteine S-methyltransferase [Actinomycetota bacterium]|nr:methylated-DNA--[protein]-cysteine S-methyltransferase [Actinomycetota bacterium]